MGTQTRNVTLGTPPCTLQYPEPLGPETVVSLHLVILNALYFHEPTYSPSASCQPHQSVTHSLKGDLWLCPATLTFPTLPTTTTTAWVYSSCRQETLTFFCSFPCRSPCNQILNMSSLAVSPVPLFIFKDERGEKWAFRTNTIQMYAAAQQYLCSSFLL